MLSDSCCFCEEFASPGDNQFFNEIGSRLGIASRVLMQRGGAVAVPTIGALTPGHLLLITRGHFHCLADVPPGDARDLLGLMHEAIGEIGRVFGKKCVAFEHGAGPGALTRANSVDHCHLHALPFERPLWGKIASDYGIDGCSEFSSAESVYAYLSEKRPQTYLYFMDTDMTHRVIEGERAFESQFFRRVIAAELSLGPIWDWRENALEDNLKKTIEKMGSRPPQR